MYVGVCANLYVCVCPSLCVSLAVSLSLYMRMVCLHVCLYVCLLIFSHVASLEYLTDIHSSLLNS